MEFNEIEHGIARVIILNYRIIHLQYVHSMLKKETEKIGWEEKQLVTEGKNNLENYKNATKEGLRDEWMIKKIESEVK